MTNSSFITTKESVGIIPVPFAHNGTKSTIGTSAGTGLINYADGFPVEYAMPISESTTGKYLIRGDFNAVGNIGTANHFFMQCGGYHTFSQAVSDLIGGYPLGAILDWYDSATGWIRKVRCIKNGGNCTIPIDDPTNGVNGSGTKYWSIVDYNANCWNGEISYGDTVTATVADFLTVESTYSSAPYTVPNNMYVTFTAGTHGHYYQYSSADTYDSFLSIYNPDTISWVPIRLAEVVSGKISNGYTSTLYMYLKKGTIIKGQVDKIVDAGGYGGCSFNLALSGKIIQ